MADIWSAAIADGENQSVCYCSMFYAGLSTSAPATANRLGNDSKSSSLEEHPNARNQEQQTALVHGSNESSGWEPGNHGSHSTNTWFNVNVCLVCRIADGVRVASSKIKGQPFRAQSTANQIEPYVEQKNMETQTSTMDVTMCHINERKQAKANSIRPSSLKLPEPAKIRSKDLYRSRTKPEEPNKLTDFHVDGNVDEIFVISRETSVKNTPK